VCAIDKVESLTVEFEKRLNALESRTRMWESLEERYQTVLTELLTEMSRKMQDKFEQDTEFLKCEIAQQRSNLHILKSVYIKADGPKFGVQTKQSQYVRTGGVSPETPVDSRRRLPSLPRINSTAVDGKTATETSRPVQRQGTYNRDSFWSHITHSLRSRQN
jgi:uncharacterized coiled-coil protein SlyX